MTTTEILMLIQAAVMFGTGVVILWYTLETKRLRSTAAAQFQVMQRSLQLQFDELKRAAEPIFVWNGGSASENHVEWQFTNEGGPISYLTITMRSPTGAPTDVQPNISPTEWLGTSRQGMVTLSGDVARELLFTIGFRTRLGSVGGFFFSASRTSKPMFTGSGWV
jgi:hypothetical protein